MSGVTQLSDTLSSMFHINPLLLLPPIIVIVAVACRVPAIPGITLGAVIGADFHNVWRHYGGSSSVGVDCYCGGGHGLYRGYDC